MKGQVVVAGNVFALEAVDGAITLNGVLAEYGTLRALGDLIHNVRVAADLQAAAKRRAEKGGTSQPDGGTLDLVEDEEP